MHRGPVSEQIALKVGPLSRASAPICELTRAACVTHASVNYQCGTFQLSHPLLKGRADEDDRLPRMPSAQRHWRFSSMAGKWVSGVMNGVAEETFWRSLVVHANSLAGIGPTIDRSPAPDAKRPTPAASWPASPRTTRSVRPHTSAPVRSYGPSATRRSAAPTAAACRWRQSHG